MGLHHSSKKGSEKEMNARQHCRAVKKGLIDAAVADEGVTYSSGGF